MIYSSDNSKVHIHYPRNVFLQIEREAYFPIKSPHTRKILTSIFKNLAIFNKLILSKSFIFSRFLNHVLSTCLESLEWKSTKVFNQLVCNFSSCIVRATFPLVLSVQLFLLHCPCNFSSCIVRATFPLALFVQHFLLHCSCNFSSCIVRAIFPLALSVQLFLLHCPCNFSSCNFHHLTINYICKILKLKR